MSKAPPSTSQNEISYSEERGSVRQSRGSARQTKMCEVSVLHIVVEFINLWLTTPQVCHVRPQAQKAGKIYPTCGFTCAAILSRGSTSKGSVPGPTPDPLVKSLRRLSLSDHSPDNHHSPQQSSRYTFHGQHSSGHSQLESPRGKRQTAPTDRRRVHQPLKCVVCLNFVAKFKFIVTITSFCNRFAGSPVAIGDMSHVEWNAQKRCAHGEALTRECVMWVSFGVLPSNLSQTYLLVLSSSTKISWS